MITPSSQRQVPSRWLVVTSDSLDSSDFVHRKIGIEKRSMKISMRISTRTPYEDLCERPNETHLKKIKT